LWRRQESTTRLELLWETRSVIETADPLSLLFVHIFLNHYFRWPRSILVQWIRQKVKNLNRGYTYTVQNACVVSRLLLRTRGDRDSTRSNARDPERRDFRFENVHSTCEKRFPRRSRYSRQCYILVRVDASRSFVVNRYELLNWKKIITKQRASRENSYVFSFFFNGG